MYILYQTRINGLQLCHVDNRGYSIKEILNFDKELPTDTLRINVPVEYFRSRKKPHPTFSPKPGARCVERHEKPIKDDVTVSYR